MELLLLGLAGFAGLALLLQSKPLPSKEDAEKAFAVLDKDPTDPDANTVFGKHKAFVMGDYDGAMPYLVHSKDATLKILAEHELDASHTATAPQKVGMADEWVAAAKKFPVLSRIFYDRASQWYVKAWPDLDGVWKDKARAQGLKLAVSRPQGGVRKGLPTGWTSAAGISGRPSVLDGTISRTGPYSVKIVPGDEKVAGAMSSFKSDMVPVIAKNQIEVTAYARSDGTDNGTDRLVLLFFDSKLALVSTPQTLIPLDTPFWSPLIIKAVVPENAVRANVEFFQYSKKGNIWVDDVTMKLNGKDVLKNGSFEDP